MQNLGSEDIKNINDTLYIELPEAELCYFKLDLSETSIYSLETGFLSGDEEKKAEFIETLYREAESQIREAALSTDIKSEVYQNAETMLRPLIETLSEMPVVFSHAPASEPIPSY